MKQIVCRRRLHNPIGIVILAVCVTPSVSFPETESDEAVWLNLDFENQTPVGYPSSWYIEGDAAASSVRVTTAEDAVDGKKSCRRGRRR